MSKTFHADKDRFSKRRSGVIRDMLDRNGEGPMRDRRSKRQKNPKHQDWNNR